MTFWALPAVKSLMINFYSLKNTDIATQEILIYLRMIFITVMTLPVVLHVITFKMYIDFHNSPKK